MATLLRESSLRGGALALVDTDAEGHRLVHAVSERMNRARDALLAYSFIGACKRYRPESGEARKSPVSANGS